MAEENENKGNSKKVLKTVALFIAIIVLICSAVYIGYYIYNNYMAEKDYADLTTTSAVATTAAPQLQENPIDFTSLQQQNNEIYGWIKIDDTEVDYPIVQSATDDEFYLKHSAVDKQWVASGAIYTEGCNNTDFSDPITVIYGHNGYKTTMFTTLHNFEKPDFFESHPYFYIYQPGRKLTYQVISAFKYDDRHIMNSYNFNSAEDLKSFQATILNPESAVQNVRNNLDVEINENSKIVVLSTCITGQKSNRLLVCGVLVKDEKTN